MIQGDASVTKESHGHVINALADVSQTTSHHVRPMVINKTVIRPLQQPFRM